VKDSRRVHWQEWWRMPTIYAALYSRFLTPFVYRSQTFNTTRDFCIGEHGTSTMELLDFNVIKK
jgi:hypothetical protein